MKRRDFIRLAGGAALALPAAAHAQFNASRPITMVVPFPAGGGADILVRMLTKYMSENLSHPFIVQNVPGAGGGLAFGQVARATPDGHTLGWVSTGFPVMAATLSQPDVQAGERFHSHLQRVREPVRAGREPAGPGQEGEGAG